MFSNYIIFVLRTRQNMNYFFLRSVTNHFP